MTQYHKIQTVWLRDPETKHKTLSDLRELIRRELADKVPVGMDRFNRIVDRLVLIIETRDKLRTDLWMEFTEAHIAAALSACGLRRTLVLDSTTSEASDDEPVSPGDHSVTGDDENVDPSSEPALGLTTQTEKTTT